MTDRVRVLVVAAALVVLPWVGRRRGWFGPVGSSITARLVRVAGCAAVCGLGVAVVRMDSHLGLGPHSPGPFSLLREIIALVLAGAALIRHDQIGVQRVVAVVSGVAAGLQLQRAGTPARDVPGGTARLSPGLPSASRSPSVAEPPAGKHAEPPLWAALKG